MKVYFRVLGLCNASLNDPERIRGLKILGTPIPIAIGQQGLRPNDTKQSLFPGILPEL